MLQCTGLLVYQGQANDTLSDLALVIAQAAAAPVDLDAIHAIYAYSMLYTYECIRMHTDAHRVCTEACNQGSPEMCTPGASAAPQNCAQGGVGWPQLRPGSCQWSAAQGGGGWPQLPVECRHHGIRDFTRRWIAGPSR